MATITQLKQIAQSLSSENILVELNYIEERMNQDNPSIVLPLIGEFSSGKTTLINALTESKILETSTMPTTATIYEIHFGCDECSAIITNPDGTTTEITDLQTLKNDELKDSLAVTLFDTSKSVPSSIILVDTPGLSSSDPRHRQTLVNFLPAADGVLLTFDINAQFTRSLEDFIKDMALTKRPIYAVVTMCDTKPESAKEEVRQLLLTNAGDMVRKIAFVSAKNNELNELCTIFESIQNEKKEILLQVNEQRLRLIENRLAENVDDLLHTLKSNPNIDDSIRKQERELKKLQQNINRLIVDTCADLQEEEQEISRTFEELISDKLDAIVAGKSSDFDNEAITAINTTVSLLSMDYTTRIQNIMSQKAKQRLNTDDSVSLRFLEEIDLSNAQITNLAYDLDLNALGHEHDTTITTATKVAGAAIAVAAVVCSAGAATGVVGAAGATASGAAATEGAVVATSGITVAEGVVAAANVADTVTDVASMVTTARHVKKIQKAMALAGETSQKYAELQAYNQMLGKRMGYKKGMVESMVGFVTDKTWGKPQRKRAIRQYVDGTLMPQFNAEIIRIHTDVLNYIKTCLEQEASAIISEKKNLLQQLENERNAESNSFEARLKQLKEYQTILTCPV